MSIHAFVDESRRGNQYMMAVVQVTPEHLSPVRSKLRRLLLPGERELHFKQEKDPRRRRLADQISSFAVTSTVYACECGRFDEPARETSRAIALDCRRGRVVLGRWRLMEEADLADRHPGGKAAALSLNSAKPGRRPSGRKTGLTRDPAAHRPERRPGPLRKPRGPRTT